MSESNGYATLADIVGQPFKRKYADEAVSFEGVERKFRLQNLNALEKGSYDSEAVNKLGKLNKRATSSADARLVALCWVDGNGSRVCGPDAVGKLQERDAGSVEELAARCRVHCGFKDASPKNDDGADDDDSSSS